MLIEAPLPLQPQNLVPFSPMLLIPQWSDVDIDGSRSGVVRTKVIEVQLGRGVLDPMIPLRIFLARPGVPGDSGALVIDAASGVGIGIYMGGLLNLAGSMEGCCQHLGQVAYAMNVGLAQIARR